MNRINLFRSTSASQMCPSFAKFAYLWEDLNPHYYLRDSMVCGFSVPSLLLLSVTFSFPIHRDRSKLVTRMPTLRASVFQVIQFKPFTPLKQRLSLVDYAMHRSKNKGWTNSEGERDIDTHLYSYSVPYFEKHSLSSSGLQVVVQKSFAFRSWKIFPPRLSPYLWLISLFNYSMAIFAVQNIVWISYILLIQCVLIRIFLRFEFQWDVAHYNLRNRNSMRKQLTEKTKKLVETLFMSVSFISSLLWTPICTWADSRGWNSWARFHARDSTLDFLFI